MSKLIELIKALVPGFKSQIELENSYLSEANNLYDLERRMHEIDVRAQNASWGHGLGQGAG